MSQEVKLTGYIIKTQDLNEADLLLTFFSLQKGKVRFLAKSAKKMISRMRSRLQPNCLLEVTLTANSNLPKIIGSEVQNSYSTIFGEQNRIQAVLVMQELLLRGLPDELPNPELYDNFGLALQQLNQANQNSVLILLSFFQRALKNLGFAPELIKDSSKTSAQVFYNLSEGKFKSSYESSQDQMISQEAYLLLENISKNHFSQEVGNQPAVELLRVLSNFAGYQLERDLKAVDYFVHDLKPV